MTVPVDHEEFAADLSLAVLDAGGDLTVHQASLVLAVLVRLGYRFTKEF